MVSAEQLRVSALPKSAVEQGQPVWQPSVWHPEPELLHEAEAWGTAGLAWWSPKVLLPELTALRAEVVQP
ncbi:MAG: hypothetical protein LAO04_22840, partial [Acidobacteriia bacterium]|nr:hypothetical protein [Terriglobia bacterium]